MLESIKCSASGAYYLRGQWVPADAQAPAALAAAGVTAEQAGQAYKGTMAYGILTAHNTSGSDRDLRIKFDAMASHDITFVGIIQTAATTACAPWAAPSTRMTTASACLLPKSTAASLCRPTWRSSTSTCASALRAAAK